MEVLRVRKLRYNEWKYRLLMLILATTLMIGFVTIQIIQFNETDIIDKIFLILILVVFPINIIQNVKEIVQLRKKVPSEKEEIILKHDSLTYWSDFGMRKVFFDFEISKVRLNRKKSILRVYKESRIISRLKLYDDYNIPLEELYDKIVRIKDYSKDRGAHYDE